MATLTGQQIDLSYQGLLKTNDNAALTGTAKGIQDGVGGATNIEMSNTATNFVSGTVDFTGSTVSGIPTGESFSPVDLSGTSQTLDLSLYNFGNGGTLTGDTTLAFSNVPTEKTFQYTYTAGNTPYSLVGASINAKALIITSNPSAPALSGFSYDGTRMWVSSSDIGGDAIYQYDLSTAWDVSTGTYASKTINVETQDNEIGPGMYWKQDGLSFWLVGNQNNSVYEYTMTTANDLSTATYSGNSFSVTAQESFPRAIYFKPDGLKFFVLGSGTDKVLAYTMTTAWDITSASYDSQSVSTNTQDTSPNGLAFSEDGSKFFMGGATNHAAYQYDMTTAWDITTASYSNYNFVFGAIPTNTLRGLAFKTGGTQLFTASRTGDQIFTADTGVATVTLPTSVQNLPTLTFLAGDVVTQSFYTLDGGTNVYYEEEPQPLAATPGLVSGVGTDSLISGPAVLSVPAVANGTTAIALGKGAIANSTNNISIGTSNNTNGSNIINIGDNNDMSAYTDNSILIRPGGGTGIAFRGDSVCIGEDTYPGAGGVQIGKGAFGKNNNPNVAIGKNSEAGDTSVAIGENADAKGNGGVAIGANAIADGSGSDGRVAIGKGADAGNNKAIAIGVNNPSCQSEGIAIGDGVSISTSDRSIAIGNAITLNTGNDKIAIGTAASVAGQRGLAFGQNASATANEAIAMGYNVTAAKAQTLAVNELETKLVGGGITMVSPNGTEYKLTVSDAGALVIS
jgi:hypothetical protein|tara:strand:- start:567 stop:2777 length:2211 start_codon:yes stop_codon:yes gene_type:complete